MIIKRKMWARAYSVDRQAVIIIGQQVLSFWGWNVYDERYVLKAGSDHTPYNWERYSLTNKAILNEYGWHTTGWLHDKNGIIIGDIKAGCRVYESLQIFAHDMGEGNKATLVMDLNY